MPDIYEASKAQTTASQREALAALARGGTAERDAYLAAQQAQQGDQQRIMQEILARATALGAPGAGAEQQAALRAGFDRRSFALAGAQGSASTALDQITKANSQYFDQVNAAVPLVKARSDEINEANRIKAEQAEADRQLALQIKELALMQSEAGLANTLASGRNASAAAQRAAAKEASGDTLSDSELRTRLLGAARATPAPRQTGNVLGVKIPLPPKGETTRAREAGIAAGLDPARVLGLLPYPKANQPSASSVLSNQNAQAELNARAARLKLLETAKRAASKGTYFELEKAIDVGEAEGDIQAALDYIDHLKPDYLKRNSISKTALVDWVKRYGAI